MEYVEKNYTPTLVVILGIASKKLLKKEVVPVSGWKQMLTTYFTVLTATIFGGAIRAELNKRNNPPKPN